MKSLEQDALKAQMVIAKSRDGKKRGTLDQLTESPSPAPTPSPTPIEGKKLLLKETVFVFSPKKLIFHPFFLPAQVHFFVCLAELSPRGLTSPGRLVRFNPEFQFLID